MRFLTANREIPKDDGALPFFHRDVRNLYVKMKIMHAMNDAMELLQYCKVAKDENTKVQFTYTLNDERKLENVFWSPSPCINWYKKYVEAIVVDITYRVNTYNMPFVIFVGVNNHGKMVLFGCALLRNKTCKTFLWLMKTFLILMKKPPKTILMDQDPWMAEAILKELPLIKHAFYIWHITSKFSGWFTAILRNKYSSWCANFYKLYKLAPVYTYEEFEDQWPQVIIKYNLHESKHANGLFQIRHFWVPSYLRGYFFVQGLGNFNLFSKSSRGLLVPSVSSYLLSVSQLTKDLNCDVVFSSKKVTFMGSISRKKIEIKQGSSLRTLSPLEKQSYDILTPYSFKMFQDEFGRVTQYVLIEDNCEVLMQYYKENSQNQKVLWDVETITCSCKHFEFWGMLCRDILIMFLHKDCYIIPSIYSPLR
ncbi:LOW QUALITY PROTEIN: MULE domain-containing protein [Cephalotus follicularis]|uniref:Protein FAR1-RELATED SEQUENCE n=1 Tax=Cephalotus follicularis TaxID=3775 RepID=A0A1Q3B9G9_CEPFO|nr:LOW QUALITY PROTEIN: MULE domain-containing protein [Cephalotus follicularis]